METVDARRALELLVDVVDQYGDDTVYERITVMGRPVCLYVHDSRPSCLVGHALVKAGADVELLETLNPGVAALSLNIHVPNVDFGAATVFQAAQHVQDDGGTWGEALEAAKRAYRRQVEVR